MSRTSNFVVTAKGFLKEAEIRVIKDSEGKFVKLKEILKFTKNLREAKPHTKKSAINMLSKHNLVGFIYNPYAEEHVKNKWEVKKRTHYEWNQPKPAVEEYEARRVYSNEVNDVLYLKNNLSIPSYLTQKQAEREAIRLNRLALKELVEKIKLQKQQLTRK